MSTLSRYVSLLVAGAAAVGCSVQADEPERVGSASSAIIGGTNSDASQNYVVQVQSEKSGCTGILISPKLVITAQHCVVTGAGVLGSGTTTNDYTDCVIGTTPVPASTMKVTFGTSLTAAPVGVARIFVDTSNSDCTKDMAILELITPVENMPAIPLYLDAPVAVGTSVLGIGWGLIGSEDAGYTPAGTRQQATGTVLVSETGGSAPTPDGPSVDIIPGFVAASLQVCNGDSGGGLFDASGALIGMFQSAISTKVTDIGGAEQAECGDSVAVAAPVNGRVQFIESAFQTVGLMPYRVGQSAPPADDGGSCRQNNQCNSNFCAFIGTDTNGVCSKECTVDSDCSSGSSCLPTGEPADSGAAQNICLPPQPVGSARGCAVSRDSSPTSYCATVLGALALMLTRRRKTRLSGRRS